MSEQFAYATSHADSYARTRVGLHGVAELLIAGPQRRLTRSIKLGVLDGGFATTAELPGPVRRIAVRPTSAGPRLVVSTDDGERAFALTGRYEQLAAEAGIDCGAPADAYPPASGVGCADRIDVDPEAADVVTGALVIGDRALRDFATAKEAVPQTPVLWPEHFDIGIVIGAVNYGVSPGDAHIAVPYAYIGPHKARAGAFWNQPFGAARPLGELTTADAVRAFFDEGEARARVDAPAS